VKEVQFAQIVDKVADMCQEANMDLGEDVLHSFRSALKDEVSDMGKDVLKQLLLNAEIAKQERIPMCQDTGMAVFVVELGQDCRIVGGSLYDAINDGVRKGYKDGYLRTSMVHHPLDRKNTGDNTPAIIHLELVSGDKLKIQMTAKGAGSENMSQLKMLMPSDGLIGVKQFILDTVKAAGPNACPPMVVGIGIGGSFERCAYLAKRSLFRPLGERNPLPDAAKLEEELIHSINQLGIGPQGLGGRTTALDVKVEIAPCHIASLPVAVNINCHASRHKETVF
jgi:fumarate hydratase subunit alpha